MYEIAQQVTDWLAEGRAVRVATVVATRGLSSRQPAASAAWTDGTPSVGALVEAITPDDLQGVGLLEITISEDEAVAAGPACGGTASVLVQAAAAFPAGVWDRLVAHEPLCLVTTLGDSGDSELFTAATIRESYPFGAEVPRLFGRGITTTAVLEGDPQTVVVALWPVPTLVVVGDGLIADALRDAATLLGWRPTLAPLVDEAVTDVARLHRSDAVVVLSHDREVDGPALAAALAGGAGYVGALGSRRTQAARREWLTANDVDAEAQARIHGPAGLDIDAHTPAEIAISIVAEILAARSTSSGGALRDREGPVHVAGVHAPPPRY